ncbi:hypothetical protein [Brevundimonas denitrificans]|uniref:hypothetical protein n=1 Tax=Brevundimonas denitrificans TaxID=1443434 RepID=UPI00223A72CA|nr:hypothetical protein [Brevundimonas denitrificans]
MGAGYPLILWRDREGYLKACACSDPRSWAFIRDDLDAPDQTSPAETPREDDFAPEPLPYPEVGDLPEIPPSGAAPPGEPPHELPGRSAPGGSRAEPSRPTPSRPTRRARRRAPRSRKTPPSSEPRHRTRRQTSMRRSTSFSF